MKNLLTAALFSFLLFPLSFLLAGSEYHGDLCDAWCKKVKECAFCSEKHNCGSGFISIAKIGSSENKSTFPPAYGCGIKAGRINPTSNSTMCHTYYSVARAKQPSVFKGTAAIGANCTTNKRCNKGYDTKASFYGGSGRNFHLCMIEDVRGRRECEVYCGSDKRCSCSLKRNCGSDHSRKALFGDWAACFEDPALTKSEKNEVLNERDCKAWCRSNPGVCAYCSPRRKCGGRDFKHLMTFNDHRPGSNWFACQKR